jgi:ribosomal protein S18 acetylase RimI-like enzyme
VERVPDGLAGYVVTLDVAPEFRRQGLARELMQRGEAEARRAGCGEMLLHVFVGNANAIRFYEKAGYSQGKNVVAFYGRDAQGESVDAWLYRKRMATECGGFPGA